MQLDLERSVRPILTFSFGTSSLTQTCSHLAASLSTRAQPQFRVGDTFWDIAAYLLGFACCHSSPCKHLFALVCMLQIARS